jgi:hypothetical protein
VGWEVRGWERVRERRARCDGHRAVAEGGVVEGWWGGRLRLTWRG